MIGQTISHYKIIEKLGEGGMGEVYLAEDTKLKRKIALKFLPAHFSADKEAIERFEREAQAAAALNHPNIITIHEIGEFEGTAGAGKQIFIAMEFVAGESLRKKISSSQLQIGEIIDLAVQICEGLSKAHQAGIIHRDIKPENILVDEDGRVKIVDFGLAKLKGVGKLTKEKSTLGTVYYMSPEQVSGQEVDQRTDIWSVGVVLYEMITGQLSFKGEYEQAVIYSILNIEPNPIPTEIPEGLEKSIHKALAKTLKERYLHINELMTDLQRIQTLLMAKPLPRAFARRRPHLSKMLTSPILWIVVIVLLGLGAGVLFFYPSAAIPFSERDWILITDFENLTGDNVFDKSLNTALAVSIGQSSYINVFPHKRITETLHRMRREGIEHINDEIGREIAIREGINVIVVPSISIIGETYALIGEIQDANTGSTFKSEIVRAQGKDEVLSALDELSEKIRKDLGESLGAISKQNKPLMKVTTSSLKALKQYSLGTENLVNLNFEEAKLYYESALQIDSNFTAAKASLGLLYFEKFDKVKGRELLTEAIKDVDNLTDRERYGILASHASVVENNLEKAVKYHKMRLALYPDDEAAQHNIGWCYQLMGRYQEAANSYKKAIQINPYAMLPYAGLSWVYLFYLGEVDSALDVCKRQISYNVQIAWTFDYLGWAYLGKDSLKQAQKAFESALELNPRFTWALSHLAQTYRLQGRFKEAIEPLEKILKINQTESSTYYDLGIIYQLLANMNTAHQYFEKFRNEIEKEIQKEPNNGNNYILLGIVLTELGEKELAWTMARKGMEIDSTQHFAYARFLSVQGMKKEALDHLEVAIKKGFTNYIWMKIHPSLQPLYDEPRFKDLIDKCLKK